MSAHLLCITILLLLCIHLNLAKTRIDQELSGHSVHNDELHRHPQNESSKQFAQFWQSIGTVMHHADAIMASIGDRIATISSEISQNSSVCYRIIEDAFRNGLQKDWSAKCDSYEKIGLNQYHI